MRRGLATAAATGVMVLIIALIAPAEAGAQTFGLGVRMAIVKGADSPLLTDTGKDSAKFMGAMARVKLGQLAIEGSVDHHAFKDDTTDATITCYPIQASLIYYFSRSKRGVYVLGGAGYYLQKLSLVDENAEPVTSTAHSIGYHLGIGLEMALTQRLAMFTDYRYTFADAPSFDEITGSALSRLGLSSNEGLDTKGSMWVTGVVIYF
jgi:opacity protein-like surface antigen